MYMCVCDIYLYIHIFDLFGICHIFTNTHTCLNELYTVVGFLNLLVMIFFFVRLFS